jgi:hypothetical protein
VYLRGHGLEGTDLVKAAMEASRTFFLQEEHFATKRHLNFWKASSPATITFAGLYAFEMLKRMEDKFSTGLNRACLLLMFKAITAITVLFWTSVNFCGNVGLLLQPVEEKEKITKLHQQGRSRILLHAFWICTLSCGFFASHRTDIADAQLYTRWN